MKAHLRTLILLFSANSISGFAQGITMLAIPWYVIQSPGGKFQNAVLVASVTFVSLFWSLYAGTLVDKYNRKHIFLTLTGVDACILLSIASLGFWLGVMPFWCSALIFTITIFTYNVHYPNLYAFVQELFEPQLYGKVNSAIEIQGQTTNFLGMMTGALLLDGTMDLSWWPEAWRFEAWSLAEIFFLDGCTYILGFLLISQIPYRPKPRARKEQGNAWVRLKFGFRYLWSRQEILIFGLTSYVIFFSLLVVIQVIAPIYVKDYLQESAAILSLFKGFYAIGAISAGLIGLSAFVRNKNLIRQVIFLLIAAGGFYLLLSLTQSIWITLGAALALGICNAGARILRITYLVKLVPNEVIGRVNSIFTVANVMARVSFIGLLALPFFSADGQGDHIVYAVALLGLIMLISAVILIANARRMDQDITLGP